MHEVNARSDSTGGGGAGSDEPLAYTVPRAAGLLELSPRKVWELVHNGTIESIKIGTSRRIPRAALVAYVESLRSVA